MSYKFGVIGVGNMAKAVISGIQKNPDKISQIHLFDMNSGQYKGLEKGDCPYFIHQSIEDAVSLADCVLLSVKPQNFPEVLGEIVKVKGYSDKLYITIAAGISVKTVSDFLGGADVVRVLPNLPMTIGQGVSVICKNPNVSIEDFSFVTSLFSSSGSTLIIDENDMNKTIGVTSSSPAYVFKFIDCVCKGAQAQGLDYEQIVSAVCDVFIGSALLLKQSGEVPETLISRVCSKGGTTECAMNKLNEAQIDNIILDAMRACTQRADELGQIQS